jgi:hypothetical protein
MGTIADMIWQVPAYLPYLQPPLTAEAVAAAEDEIGYKLPSEYLDLIRKQNGGYIRYALPDSPHDTIAGIGPYFPSLTRVDWAECQDRVSYRLEGLVPYDGDGHWHLCLDYRSNSEIPAVILRTSSAIGKPMSPTRSRTAASARRSRGTGGGSSAGPAAGRGGAGRPGRVFPV